MKITLAVLFLAGLTIYCRCTLVLSLPPSLIAHAASLEERLKTQKTSKTTKTDNGGGGVVGVVGGEEQLQQDEEEDANNVAADFYKNLKNMWQKDLSLNFKKRERNTFEDDIADVATQQQQQQQQPITTIKNNNKIGLQQIIPPPQQQQQHDNNGSNNNNKNILKSTPSAATMNEPTNLNIEPQPLPFEEYDSNEWLAPSSAEMTNDDDIFVSPSLQPLLASERATNFETLDIAPTQSQIRDSNFAVDADSVFWNKYVKPMKYWTRPCQLENENNCPQEYYRALIADRNDALLKQLQYKQNMQTRMSETSNPFTDFNSYATRDSNVSPSTLPSAYHHYNNDDIVLLLTAEQNLIQFLSWALAELYPFGKFENQSVDGADSYHPGMYLWKKLNVSGRLEPPLLVDEPHYVIVTREYAADDGDSFKRALNYDGDPFIPPRGRKHNLPDIDSLLERYETFVPNRGRRDKIKDIFKSDDLFYPNRGKRQMTEAPMSAAANDIGDIVEWNDNNVENQPQLNNEDNVQQLFQYPLSSNKMTMEQLKNVMAKMKRKLHQNQRQQQKLKNSFDEMSKNKPTRMSTTFQQLPPLSSSLLSKRFKSMFNILHKQQRQKQQHKPNQYNAGRQWLKRYTTTSTTTHNDRPASVRSRSMATNRLQTLRSMSPLQQLTLQYQQHQQNQHLQQHQADYLSPPLWQQATKFMWQPRQQQLLKQQQQQPLKSLAQQFDPLSWHKLQMLQHQYHLPLLTMRHPRLTALPHLPTLRQQQQQHQRQQLATPQETQLTYSPDRIDNSITNDLENSFNKDLD